MAKTPLFERLRRIAARSLSVEALQAATVDGPRITRRGLLQVGAAGFVAGCTPEPDPDPTDPEQPAPHRIAVIGAGLAGLHCAYRLFKAGADVTVYDANSRVGGRVFTGLFRNQPELAYELGGEFIDTQHVTMVALIKEFMLGIDDRNASGAQFKKDVIWLGGKEVDDGTIAAQFERVAPAFAAALSRANRESSAFSALDLTPLSEFLDLNVPSSELPELSALLRVAFRSEFGLEPSEQSALNLMFLVGSADLASFHVFGAADRRLRVRGGNGKLPEALADALGNALDVLGNALDRPNPRVKLDERLTRIASLGSSTRPLYSLSFMSATGVPSEVQAERVVFALPFSVLDHVDLNGLGLSSAKRQLIGTLGYGKSVKLAGAFSNRIWGEAQGGAQAKSGSVFSDLGFQELWDSSIGDIDPRGVLTSMTGGDAGARADISPVPESMAALLAELEPIIPGVGKAFLLGSAVRMHWPSAPLSRGSNACFTPGQWARRGLIGRREGNLHFCGEHCSLDFPGRMEGAAETSALVAAEILEELGLALSPVLTKIIEVKTAVPQPTYRNGDALGLGIVDRLALVAHAHAAP